jgi:hypothetical protein
MTSDAQNAPLSRYDDPSAAPPPAAPPVDVPPVDDLLEEEPVDDQLDEEAPTEAVTADAVATRAELLPEEQAAGSDDPEGQARVVLEDSLVRTERPDAAPTTFVEHRRSEDTL